MTDIDETVGPDSARLELARLKEAGGVQLCCDNAPIGAGDRLRLAIYFVPHTQRYFLEVTDGQRVRVGAFVSQLKRVPPETREQGIPLADIADLFRFARQLARHWPGLAIRPRSLSRRLRSRPGIS